MWLVKFRHWLYHCLPSHLSFLSFPIFLLQFVTGTSSIPFEGFKALRGSNSVQKFTIDSQSGTYNLPMYVITRHSV